MYGRAIRRNDIKDLFGALLTCLIFTEPPTAGSEEITAAREALSGTSLRMKKSRASPTPTTRRAAAKEDPVWKTGYVQSVSCESDTNRPSTGSAPAWSAGVSSNSKAQSAPETGPPSTACWL